MRERWKELRGSSLSAPLLSPTPKEGVEMFDSTMLEVIYDFDLGAWDVGAIRLKWRQLTQMANRQIIVDMEHYKHELQQIAVSKPDKAKLERLLSVQEMKHYRSGVALGALDGWLINAVRNFPSASQNVADDRTMQPFRTCSS